ncbi:MAG: hypothetical protein Q8M39_05560 [Sulfuricurvum sp.]|nr:hypothetical protein [Sulfuricurvum sp.]
MLDELITDLCDEDRLRVNDKPLSTFLDFKLVRIIEDDPINHKSYIRLIIIMIGNEMITTINADANQMKAEIRLFDRGNIYNRFFKIASLNSKSKKFKQLGYTDEDKSDGPGKNFISLTNMFSLKQKMFIGIADSIAIIDNWNEAFVSYSKSRLIEFPSEQTLVSMAKLLKKYGYIA